MTFNFTPLSSKQTANCLMPCFILLHFSSNLYKYHLNKYYNKDVIISIFRTRNTSWNKFPQVKSNTFTFYLHSQCDWVSSAHSVSVRRTYSCLYIWRAALAKKHVRSKSPTDSSSGEYDDIVGPVYETITTSGNSSRDTKVSMTENEAYKVFTSRKQSLHH